MHDARTVVGGHEVGGDHPPAVAVGGEPVEGPVVPESDQLGGRDRRHHHRILAEHRGHAVGAEHEVPSPGRVPHARVGDVGADRGAHVAHEGPRRGGPHEEVEVGADHREADVDRILGDVLVCAGLAELVARQRGAAPAAVGDDLGALVDEVAVPQLVEQPPHALDVVVAHRGVGVGEVEPHADAARQRRPVLHVPLDRVPAALVEGLDAVVLDLGLAREPELLLDLDLHRQAVAVPPRLPGDVLAPHRVETGVDVLEEPGPDVVDAGAAVGGGRTLVEDPFRRALASPQRLGEHVVRAPAAEDAVFERDEVEPRIDGVEGHARTLPSPSVDPGVALPCPASCRLPRNGARWPRPPRRRPRP